MNFIETPIAGAYVIEPKLLGDERGFFTRAFCLDTFKQKGIDFQPLQSNHAASAKRGTLRGLHYQSGEAGEAKLVRCIKGAIFDVLVDTREDSPTYLKWFGCELSAENKHMLFVPKGFAHAYLTLTDDSEVYYLVDQVYTPEAECGMRWNDPKLSIDWPITDGLTISDKDQKWDLL
jgi:dTDP-4-dehydrorhamnose 3,5-epimerase